MAIFGNDEISQGYWDGNQYIFKKAQQPTFNEYDPAITPPSLLAPDIDPILSPIQYNYGRDADSEDRKVGSEYDPTSGGLFGGLNPNLKKQRDIAYAGMEEESPLNKFAKVAGVLNPALGALSTGASLVNMAGNLNEISENDLGLGTSRSFWDKLVDPRSFAQQAYDAKNIADMVNKATDKYGKYGRPTSTGAVTQAPNSLAQAAAMEREQAEIAKTMNEAARNREGYSGGASGGQGGGIGSGFKGGAFSGKAGR